MTLNLHIPPRNDTMRPRITVIGVGGAGGNAVNNMINANLEGVSFVVANTDAQALEHSLAEKKVQLGPSLTRGLGAGAVPDVGRGAAEEVIEEMAAHLDGSNMVFITAGMGGGTGSGAAPVIARMAREQGILTVGVVTKPFQFEGSHRMRIAEGALNELQQYVDTLIVIPNQNLFRLANEKTTFADAFKMADDVLHSGVRGVTDLMVMPGLINLDFADIRTVMREMGKAMMGTGEAEGDRRAIDAAEAAISNPLLDDVSMKGARGVLINITGGPDITLYEVDEAANRIREEVDPEANIIFGSTFNSQMQGKIRVSVVATGIEAASAAQPKPHTQSAAKPAAPKAYPMPQAAVAPSRPQPAPGTVMALQSEGAAPKEGEPVFAFESKMEPVMVAPVMAAAAGGGQASQAFIPPRPVEPQQRPTPYFASTAAVRPQAKPIPSPVAKQVAESKEAGGFNLFNTLGRALSGKGEVRPELQAEQPRRETPRGEAPLAETKAQKADEYLEIPAFLRRQAN
ncbi:MAG: cell division protein FtsZ [Alphaproteobacteria bacterium]|nr:cell division protein FtsZ [Alphaproteobacteria bacterium]